MANRNRYSPKGDAGDAQSAEQVLNSVMQELDALHENVKGQLNQDITRLQTEKNHLIEDIEGLREQYRKLQSQQMESLSGRYIQQQQLWLKQLAQILAHNLQDLLVQRFNELSANSGHSLSSPIPSGEFPIPMPPSNYDERASELLAALDERIDRSFQMLEQDLSSYESELSMRLNNMKTLELQGEELLQNLVNRIREELVEEEYLDNPFDAQDSYPEEATNSIRPQVLPPTPADAPRQAVPQPSAAPAAVATATSQVQAGLILALSSAVVLSLFNVCLRILIKSRNPRMIFGVFELDGVVTRGFGNSLLILLMRLIVVMALMPVLATFLYPSVWKDLKRFFYSRDLSLWSKVLGSAFFLFLSQVLIYLAIGNIPAGIAITIFFIYPIVTVLGSWFLFGARPSTIGFLAMLGITAGLILVGSPSFAAPAPGGGNVEVGVAAALASGITFAGYVLLTQMAAGKLHPIPFSLVNFGAIFVFSSLSLWVPLSENLAPKIDQNVWPGLIVGGVVLGVLTLFSYLLNNFAIRFAGAALASVIGTLGPAMTALFGFIIINEKLQPVAILGMAVVTLSVAAMSVERMVAPQKKAT
ncbi:MAG: DMT family transporter [Oscillatoriales cyanobacterium]|jgi:drug/metabolite transporter (DMT)-like permease|uniref:DMT family transporter n=1 Tax=Microcoleus sp. PH2017_05_CCC_O_A TaxID=2798816 RepID=UPI001D2F4AA6|nr:DMT family transporter [Microcoleus sp. PH2017_05_CCC_O_A]MCC3466162.1 EamA family transporter [Microcoleus sp. PH2017_06_SFM_O_A]TAG02876.1 MAG: DMT family transporter [Oscillatoriales cyanobacterium]MCC3439004.1 EamA family transporter [Microcoleus sp. PH2017_05_CCC_O_A]TAG12714.1 MAG: DMT family transporter [Oscillatoriales cyanobacterium]TAG35961.1 MAG: DMT family transporter [Oscillatoriales cyanobacterium]